MLSPQKILAVPSAFILTYQRFEHNNPILEKVSTNG